MVAAAEKWLTAQLGLPPRCRGPRVPAPPLPDPKMVGRIAFPQRTAGLSDDVT